MKVSVVIPFYNLERYVSACLDSVVAAVRNANVELEAICVDDGSTDGTPAALDGYASSELPASCSIRVVHKPNGGEGSARNAGLDVASGDWVAFLDGDDVWLPNHLSVAEGLIGNHPDADIISLLIVAFADGADAPKPSTAVVPPTVFDVEKSIPNVVLRDFGVFPTFFRREFLGGEKFTDLVLGADRLFVACCLARAHKVVRSETIVHGYRIRAESAMRSKWKPEKTLALVDYSAGSLRSLASCGKAIEKGYFTDFLAAVLLFETPKNCGIFSSAYKPAWKHWREVVKAIDTSLMSRRYRAARRIIMSVAWSRTLSLLAALALRRLKVTR